MDTYRRIFQWLKPYRRKLITCIVLLTLMTALRMVVPYITQAVVNDVLPNRNMPLLLKLCAALIGMTAVRSVMMYKRGMLIENVSQSVVYDLRTGLYGHMQELSYSFFDTHHIGEIMSRMTGDIEGVRVLIVNGVVGVIESSLMFVLSLVGMSLMSWRLTLIMVCFCPAIAVVAWRLHHHIRPAHIAVREQNAVLNTRTQENISGVRVVKAFAREEYEKQCFEKDNQLVLNNNLRVTRLWSTYFPLLDTIANLALPVLVVAGAAMVGRGMLDIGTLVGATGFVWMLIAPMRQVATFVNMTANGVVSSEKLIYYMDLGSQIKNPQEPQTPIKREGRVDFDHVTFKYGDKTVLHDIDLHVEPGQVVAVMGATGMGKTSLVTLLGRYYDVAGGSLLVDGVDVREQDMHCLRDGIGVVMQETFLFSETIFNNIRFGRPEATQAQVEAAARAAQAEEFIAQTPQGYDTVVGERGMGLSGGQKQRVALARAILYDPSILVLDDATSAVDMETEAEIQQALARVLKGRTTFIIAHRISSVRKADQIIMLQDGRIAERGTHRELLARNGVYAALYHDQTRDFESVRKAGDE
ncbi:MAG: ABC transporter ATP-binding protein/permease [Eubacteriales bacterium]|nr:ABC transporter ATP-binding protein/permease [Eubacteriales bacterium]